MRRVNGKDFVLFDFGVFIDFMNYFIIGNERCWFSFIDLGDVFINIREWVESLYYFFGCEYVNCLSEIVLLCWKYVGLFNRKCVSKEYRLKSFDDDEYWKRVWIVVVYWW